jgi:hypothetical protein
MKVNFMSDKSKISWSKRPKWIWDWMDIFFRVVWRKDGYFWVGRCTINNAAFLAKVVADYCNTD